MAAYQSTIRFMAKLPVGWVLRDRDQLVSYLTL